MTQGRFRWKAILLLIVCFTLAGAGWYFLHRIQMRAMQPRLLEQATRAETDSPPEYKRAATFLNQYLMVNRDDVDVQARLGVLVEDKLPNDPKFVRGIYEEVLRQDDKRHDIRKRLAKLYVKHNGFADALKHLEKLKEAAQYDAEMDVLEGNCWWALATKLAQQDATKEESKNKLAKAKECYAKAIETAPHNVDAYTQLAGLSLALNSPGDAIGVLKNLVENNPREARAYRIRAFFRQNGYKVGYSVSGASVFGLLGSPLGQFHILANPEVLGSEILRDLNGADQDLIEARKLAPEDADVLLASAHQETLLARENGSINPKSSHLENARLYLKVADRLHPKDSRILPQLSKLERDAGQMNKALDALRNALNKATGRARNGLLWDLANLLIDENILEEAKDVIQQLKKNGEPSQRVKFLLGTLAIQQGKWHEATKELEEARPLFVGTPRQAMRTDMLLGMCYEQLNNLDQALAIYQRARKLDPLNPQPRIGLVNCLANLGRWDEAIEEGLSLKELPSARSNVAVQFQRAKVLLLRSLGTPSLPNRWADVTAALNALKANNPHLMEVDILRAEVAAARNNFKEAKEILEAAREYAPQDVEPWIALAGVAARESGAAEALAILKEAKAKFKDLPELRLAKLRYLPQKKEEALAFLRPLREGLGEYNHSMQARLLTGLAEAFERAGDVSEAENLWKELIRLEPNQIRARVAIFELYLRSGNRAGMEMALAAINDDKTGIEGADGPFGLFGKAQLAIYRADHGEINQLGDARRYLQSAEDKYPRWARIPEALAAVAERVGDADSAVKYWSKAVDLGSRHLPVIQGLVAKLMETRQYTEADALLRKFQDAAPISGYLQKIAAEASLYSQDTARAIELTRNAVSENSKDYKDYIWKGQMFMLGALTKEPDEKAKLKRKIDAESSFVRATELAGELPDPWLALVQFYVANKDSDKTWPEKALAVIKSMQTKVPAAKLPFALARSYESIDKVTAEKYYQAALSAQPDDLGLLQSVVLFHLNSGQAVKAEPNLRRLLDPKTHWVSVDGSDVKVSEDLRSWARRTLARILGSQNNPDKTSQAMRFIDENLARKPSSLDDQIIKASLLAERADGRHEAINILEKAYKVRPPTAEQMFILANLYESEWDWPKARNYMQELLSTYANHPKYAEYLATYIGKLLLYGDANGAEVWLARLQELKPHASFTLDRLVRYHAKRKNGSAVVSAIKKYLESKDSEPPEAADRLARASGSLTDVARFDPDVMKDILPQSEKLLKSFAEKSGKMRSKLAVANFLAYNQRLEESLDLCEQALKELPAQQVVPIAVAAVVLSAEPKPKQIQRVEAWVYNGQRQQPENVEWDNLLATLSERDENYAQAAALYRKVLQKEPQNLVANNNLAFLLGLQGKGAEANAFMGKALDAVVGLNGEVLDTRSVILRIQGRLKEAEKDIREALRQQKTPTRLFHLAQILQSADDSKKAFGDAMQMGLRSEMLHPLERESFRGLESEYKFTK
ncbi:MAG TPA: tetratricopeptide repeat protein [Gemmataceae bacterium]|jgi:tetratricopeptide (TPR) repeat protein|nr:tetratricopeptide repeat protein [Gemmataceae bacterium]